MVSAPNAVLFQKAAAVNMPMQGWNFPAVKKILIRRFIPNLPKNDEHSRRSNSPLFNTCRAKRDQLDLTNWQFRSKVVCSLFENLKTDERG